MRVQNGGQSYRVTVDVPARFRNSKAVGAVFGLTPSKYQSGQNDRTGAIITVRRRDDADDALRSGPEHAGAFDEMVLAQGLGNEGRQASRDEEGDRGAGASVGRDHAPRVG